MHPFAIAAGYLLDLCIGDPAAAWHPVRLVGRFISAQEKVYRRFLKNELIGGAFLAFVTPVTVFLLSLFSLMLMEQIHYLVAVGANAMLVWASISPSMLAKEADAVRERLVADDVQRARQKLSMLVGRDTAAMDRPAIVRAAVETVAENSVDGVIAPLFFAAIGGGPLAFAYRAVNTCDSMVGYRNERYERFGKFSARLDDLLTFVPARLSLILIAAAALAGELNLRGTLAVGLRDRKKHPSPNSAHGEAAFAGALGIRLGGPSHYGGVLKVKPWLGEEGREAGIESLSAAIRLLRLTAFLTALTAAGASYALFH